MKRTWLNEIATLSVLSGIVCTTALAAPPGGMKAGSANLRGGASLQGISRASAGGGSGMHKPRVGSVAGTPQINVRSPLKTSKPVLTGPLKTGSPLVPINPIKPPVGTIGPVKPPIGPIKPPVVGPIGPIKPPVVGPIGPIKPPGIGPIGPIKPPVVGPIGPINPPIGPIGPVNPPGGGGGSGGHSGGCEPCKIGCKPWWWYITPYYSTCYKPSYPVVYTQPIVIHVPVQAPAVVEPATPVADAAPLSETAPATSETPPSASEVDQPLQKVPVGATLTLYSLNLGDASGQVMLQIDKMAIPAMINEWSSNAVTATLPVLGLAEPARAEIVMVKADGTVANTVKVELIQAQPQIATAAGDTAALASFAK